jgi:2-C-methyl-D-erythritol 4-phosphate cytidylyltransferase
MGLDRNKVYVELAGRPVITWALTTCEQSPQISHIALVHREIDSDEVVSALAGVVLNKLCATVPGGASRTASELAGLAVARRLLAGGALCAEDPVLIHDGARPFLTTTLISQLVDAAIKHGGAIPGFAPATAFARVAPNGRLTPLVTSELRRVQTPQVFRAGDLLAAYDAALTLGFEGVDTAQVLERFGPRGFGIAVVPADSRNIKITVAADLARGEEIARCWTAADWRSDAGPELRHPAVRAGGAESRQSQMPTHRSSTVRRHSHDA